METYRAVLDGVSFRSIIETASRFTSGDVKNQNRTFAPSIAEFVQEARRIETMYSAIDRPREYKAIPVFTRNPLTVRLERLRSDNAHREILFEDINFDKWRRLSAERMVPVGASWVAALGTVYGPDSKQSKAA